MGSVPALLSQQCSLDMRIQVYWSSRQSDSVKPAADDRIISSPTLSNLWVTLELQNEASTISQPTEEILYYLLKK